MIEGRLRVKQTTPGNIRYGRIQMKAFTTAVSRIDNYNLHGFSVAWLTGWAVNKSLVGVLCLKLWASVAD